MCQYYVEMTSVVLVFFKPILFLVYETLCELVLINWLEKLQGCYQPHFLPNFDTYMYY